MDPSCCRNCVVIMTSNVGADIISKVGEEHKDIPPEILTRVMERFKKQNQFPVEFLNRIDEIIMFVSITTTSVHMSWKVDILTMKAYAL